MADLDIATDEATRAVYATDNSIYQLTPAGVATPTTADQIAALLAANHRSASPKPIAARGGGTGTNGQSLTTGVMVDLKRNLNRIIEIDPEAMTAVVEPGVVTAKLNAVLAPHGLHWAPHTSTLNRATVGGMISTDAAGKGSLLHGRAHRHIRSLDVILADGTPWTAAPTSVSYAKTQADHGHDAHGRPVDETVARLWRQLLELPVAEGQDFGFPSLARGFSGYGLDRLRRGDMIDPIALLCGAEGTLGIITRATLSLTPLPAVTALLVASYDSFGDALDDAVELRETEPSAIECFDETTLERGRSSPAWPALGAVVGDHNGAVLLLEYTSADETAKPDLTTAEAALTSTGRSRAVKALHDRADQAAAWKVRADAVGLLAKVALGRPEHSARPTAFVEDCAVPVDSMSAFIADFRAVLDGAGLSYGMFGHADVGCVHVRPALDLTNPAHEVMVRSVTDAVVELVARHGGVLWGEHGRGFRGDSAEVFLRPETIALMRQVKTIFDPNDLLNPGKLYRPIRSDEPASHGSNPGRSNGEGSLNPIVAVDDPPLRGHADRSVPVDVRQRFDSAFACNGNGLCHHYGGTEVMCPSYKATGDPALSPKGRADLLRAWLNRRHTGDANLSAFEDAVAKNLNQCLSCSACSGRCPVEVDIPEMKSRFFEEYYRSRRRPQSHTVLSRFEELAATMTRPGRLASLTGRTERLAGLGTGPAGKLLGLVDLPSPKRPVAEHRPFTPGRSSRFDVVVMPDVFTASLDPHVLADAVEMLETVGLDVGVAPFVASGKFDHVKGRRRAFASAVAAQGEMVADILDAGAQPVVIEPAIALLHQAEYTAIDSLDGLDAGRRELHAQVRHLVSVLDDHLERLPVADQPMPIRLLAHCTERATAPEVVAAWVRVLSKVGHSVSVPDIGCCGMAGIFGHEVDNQELSQALWDLTWADQVADTTGVPVATGYSCRSQAGRFADRLPVLHPVQVMQ